MPQLDFSTFPTQIFWLVVTFMALYWVLSRHFLPQIADIIEQRHQRVEGDMERARQLHQEAEAIRYHYEHALRDARAEGSKLVGAAMDKIVAMQHDRMHKLDESLHHQMQEAELRIQNARDMLTKEVQDIAQNIAVDAVAKIQQAATMGADSSSPTSNARKIKA